MVDQEVHHHVAHEQAQSGVERMCESNQPPVGVRRRTALLLLGRFGSGVAFLSSPNYAFGLLCCCELDEICGEQMTWNQSVEK